MVARATSCKSDGVSERSEVVEGKEYKLVLVSVMELVVEGMGEEGLVTTATSTEPAAYSVFKVKNEHVHVLHIQMYHVHKCMYIT